VEQNNIAKEPRFRYETLTHTRKRGAIAKVTWFRKRKLDS
jgi:hypothetical protein